MIAHMGAMGKRLLQVRKEKKWSQQKMSRETGVPQATISELEIKGGADIRGGTLLKLCRSLHLNPWWLVYGTPPKNPYEGDLDAEAVELARNWMRLKSDLRMGFADTIKRATNQPDLLVDRELEVS